MVREWRGCQGYAGIRREESAAWRLGLKEEEFARKKRAF